MIPKGWAYSSLAELASIKRGKFSVRPRNDPKYFGGNIPFVQTGDVAAAGKYLTHFSQTLNDDGVAVSKVFPAGTILITIAANIGDTAITTFPVACPDSVVGIEPLSNRANTEWLRAAIAARKADLHAQAPQNAQKNINLEVLKPLSLLTPPLYEQRRIAEILATWDRAIETVEALIASATAEKSALMQMLLSGKMRLRDFTGEWSTVTLSSIGSTFGGLSGKSKEDFGQGSPFITYRNVFENPIADPKKIDLVRVKAGENQHMVRYGDVIFTTSSETPKEVGMTSVIMFDHHPVYMNSFCFGFRPFSLQVLNPRFASYLFRSYGMRRKIIELAQGSTRYNVSKKAILALSVSLPSAKEQEALSELLDSVENVCLRRRDQLTALRQEKAALMQQLLTGKRRVKTAESDAP